MKANEKDFYSFYVLCHVYTSFIPLVQLNNPSFFFVGVGGWGPVKCLNNLYLRLKQCLSRPLKEVMSVGVLNI